MVKADQVSKFEKKIWNTSKKYIAKLSKITFCFNVSKKMNYVLVTQ